MYTFIMFIFNNLYIQKNAIDQYILKNSILFYAHSKQNVCVFK